jgi:hypothetical protein
MLIEGKNINESSKQKYLSKGWGELLKQETKEKEVKVKKETKEFKISKETKDETNKD